MCLSIFDWKFCTLTNFQCSNGKVSLKNDEKLKLIKKLVIILNHVLPSSTTPQYFYPVQMMHIHTMYRIGCDHCSTLHLNCVDHSLWFSYLTECVCVCYATHYLQIFYQIHSYFNNIYRLNNLAICMTECALHNNQTSWYAYEYIGSQHI